jgi:hypothetical protein
MFSKNVHCLLTAMELRGSETPSTVGSFIAWRATRTRMSSYIQWIQPRQSGHDRASRTQQGKERGAQFTRQYLSLSIRAEAATGSVLVSRRGHVTMELVSLYSNFETLCFVKQGGLAVKRTDCCNSDIEGSNPARETSPRISLSLPIQRIPLSKMV